MEENQIEEMSKILGSDCGDCQECEYYRVRVKEGINACYFKYAEMLYNAGYRKQSEWISVEERLPELEDGRNWGNHRPRSIRVLCVCQQRSGKVFVKEGYYELFSNRPCWRIPGSIDSVTHWMPLPEPPKGE